jgi:hypothetical protein
VNADRGTIVSRLVLTEGAEEAELLPVAAKALVAALREELEAILAAVAAALLLLLAALLDVMLPLLLTELPLLLLLPPLLLFAVVTVPTTALLVCVPLAVPPVVLT